jgi:hypothetical protein
METVNEARVWVRNRYFENLVDALVGLGKTAKEAADAIERLRKTLRRAGILCVKRIRSGKWCRRRHKAYWIDGACMACKEDS